MTNSKGNAQSGAKALEMKAFALLAVFLAPALSIGLVGGLGLAIWIYQLIAGPPGPPGQ